MHTLAHIGFYIAVVFAMMATGFGAALVLFAYGCLAMSEGVAITPRGNFPVPKDDIGIDWAVPGIFAATGLFWALVAAGLHAI
jgi:hypothetical protein